MSFHQVWKYFTDGPVHGSSGPGGCLEGRWWPFWHGWHKGWRLITTWRGTLQLPPATPEEHAGSTGTALRTVFGTPHEPGERRGPSWSEDSWSSGIYEFPSWLWFLAGTVSSLVSLETDLQAHVSAHCAVGSVVSKSTVAVLVVAAGGDAEEFCPFSGWQIPHDALSLLEQVLEKTME